jgi:DNA-binding LytR/AlgR family response regulator
VTPLRTLVVDDEPLAIDRLVDLLSRIDGVELVGSAESGAKAIDAIAWHRPDLVLLDVEMPKIDGFDVVERLSGQDWPGGRPTPLIAFVTAFPQFALDAFDTGALDFLCKPVRLPRLEKTIARARASLGLREGPDRLSELSDKLDALRKSRLPRDERSLWVNRRGGMVRVDIASVDWIEAEGEYVKLHVGETSHMLRTPIGYLTTQLESEGFIRVHRSAAINRNRLRGIRRSRQGVSVLLESGVEVPLGRTFRHVLKAITSPSRILHEQE